MFDGTILLAGSISTGFDIAVARAMGADLAYMGTRFINTAESMAPGAYQDMIVGRRRKRSSTHRRYPASQQIF